MEKLWTTAEVARFLGLNDIDVEQLVREGKLTGYKLGGQFVRFRPDQVEALKATMRFRRSVAAHSSGVEETWLQRSWEFVYFYDFYLVAAGFLALLVVYLMVG